MSDGTTSDVTTVVTWVTNNVNICTINAQGVLTAVAAGTCGVTAVINNITGTHTVICFIPATPPAGPPAGPPTGPPGGDPPPGDPPPPGPPSGPDGALRIEGPSQVQVGQAIQLRAFRTDNNQEVTDQANWFGNNPGVGAVGSQGRVTGVSNGFVDVSAQWQGFAGTKTVQVVGGSNPPPTCPGPGCPPPPVCPGPNCPPGTPSLTSLVIQGVTSVQVGQTSQLQAIASYSNGSTQNVTNQSTWSSGNPGVAPVNATGLVSGQSAGTAPISATFEGQQASVNFVVTGGNQPPPTPTVNSLTVTGTSPLTVGQSSQYNAVASLSDGSNPNVNGQAQWASSNPGVATVGSSGLVTAVSAGQTTISATYQGRSGSVPLTVVAAAPDLIGLELRIGANVLTGSGPLGLNLSLSDLINGNPIIDIRVFALYSDGSKVDVTSASVIDSPLLAIDGQGVTQLVVLLLQNQLNPNHYINVRYQGFTANVNVTLQLPVLQSLGFPSNTIQASANNLLPSLSAVFSQGITSNVDATFPGIQYALTMSGPVASVLQTALNLIGQGGALNSLFSIVNGRVTVSPVVNTLLTNPLTAPVLAPILQGGRIPLNLVATLNGVTSNTVTLLVIP